MKRSIGRKETDTESNVALIEITQTEYDEMKKKGYDDEELLAPGKHVFRRVTPDRVASREDLHPSNTKVQITMKVDLDILNHFKYRATLINAAPYQTQINTELRAIMERDQAQEKAEIEETAKRLLENEDFLKAVSEKLKEKELQTT